MLNRDWPCRGILRKQALLTAGFVVAAAGVAVLEAAILWMDRNLGALDLASQCDAASRLVARIKLGLLLPYAKVSAWERSHGVRLFDPHRQLIGELLRIDELAPAQQATLWAGVAEAGGQETELRSMWEPRPCASVVRELVHEFKVRLFGPARSRARALPLASPNSHAIRVELHSRPAVLGQPCSPGCGEPPLSETLHVSAPIRPCASCTGL
jgi:hypothetical protein